MRRRTIDLKYGKLHLVKTKKFKTINIKVVLKDEIKKEDITKRNCLTDYLTLTTNKHKTKRELALRTQELYSLYTGAYNSRFGNYLITRFELSFLEPKYTDSNMLSESIGFLHEIIFEPNVENGMFKEDLLNIIKKDIKMEIETIKENSKLYSNIRMLECLGEDKPYSYHGFGYLEDLEKITTKNLYLYYKEFISKCDVDIYVCGNFDDNEIISLIKEKLDFKTFKKEKCKLQLDIEKPRLKIQEVIEESNFSQSKLSIGCKILKLDDFRFKYALNIYNMILGGGFNSKFMQEIREKDSLAYYITSNINKVDNLMIIQSGISYKNYHKVISSVKNIMKRISKGDFTEEELESAKVEYISYLDEIEDNIEHLIESEIIKTLMGHDDLEIRKGKIEEVGREDIIEVAKNIKIDTIYLLKGAQDGKD